MNTRTLRVTSILLLLVNSIGAISGGASFLLDPTGQASGLSLHLLKYSPFQDYFIPGLVLILANGLFGLLVLCMIWARIPRYPVFIALQGILLGGWILIQMIMLRSVNFLNVSFLIIAIALISLSIQITRSKKKHYEFN